MRRARSNRSVAVSDTAQGQLDLFAASVTGTRPPLANRERKTMPVREALHRYGIGHTKLYELLGSGALKLGAKTLIDVECADSFFSALSGSHRS